METARLFWEINMDVPQKTLPQKTADQIIDYVVENHLKPGEKLPTEKELSARLCVSRSVMREALSILATMHIIRAVHGKTRKCHYAQFLSGIYAAGICQYR